MDDFYFVCFRNEDELLKVRVTHKTPTCFVESVSESNNLKYIACKLQESTKCSTSVNWWILPDQKIDGIVLCPFISWFTEHRPANGSSGLFELSETEYL